MKFFRSEMTPLPFRVSPKIHPFWQAEASLIHQTYLLTSNADNWITSDKTEEEILNFFNEICLVINICLHICLLYHLSNNDMSWLRLCRMVTKSLSHDRHQKQESNVTFRPPTSCSQAWEPPALTSFLTLALESSTGASYSFGHPHH